MVFGFEKVKQDIKGLMGLMVIKGITGSKRSKGSEES